jgi:hypothetical protein
LHVDSCLTARQKFLVENGIKRWRPMYLQLL